MLASAPRIWGLLDDKAGHANQVRGLIEALPIPAQSISLMYNRWAMLPNALLGATMCHLRIDVREGLKALMAKNAPSLVIACGRRTEPVARAIKRAHPATKIVYIMRPSSMTGWDCVIVPKHDKPSQNDARIIETLGPLHRITPATLEQACLDWQERFSPLSQPRIGVLMGDVSVDGARRMIAHAQRLAGQEGSLLVSNSRRTIKGLLHATLRDIECSHDVFDVHHSHGENPYPGILAHADKFIVSGDSLSMCAEVVATGKPVTIDDLDKALPKKHRAMHQSLYASGRACSMKDGVAQHLPSTAPANEIEKIAAELHRRFLS